FWTKEWVPGKRFGGDKPVYVLTRRWTFSGAEEFTYNLKNLKRATIIGEVTGGGAHPVRPHRINEYFTIGVPFARAINPITKTNWEGTGVTPDVEVPAAQALKTAHLAALKSVQSKATDPQLAGQLKNLIESVQRELDEMRSPAPRSPRRPSRRSRGLRCPPRPPGKRSANSSKHSTPAMPKRCAAFIRNMAAIRRTPIRIWVYTNRAAG